MAALPTHAICILEAAGQPEKYDAFLDALIDGIDDNRTSEEQIRCLVKLATDFPERCFQFVGNGLIDKPLFSKEPAQKLALYELPTLEHMCCGLGYSEHEGKIKVHIVRGMECIVFSQQHNAFMMVTVNDGVFERASNPEGQSYFKKTSGQGFMKANEAVYFFERQRKLAQPVADSNSRRPALKITIPSFANREFHIGG